jgi:hypothetical protein
LSIKRALVELEKGLGLVKNKFSPLLKTGKRRGKSAPKKKKNRDIELDRK